MTRWEREVFDEATLTGLLKERDDFFDRPEGEVLSTEEKEVVTAVGKPLPEPVERCVYDLDAAPDTPAPAEPNDLPQPALGECPREGLPSATSVEMEVGSHAVVAKLCKELGELFRSAVSQYDTSQLHAA